jgi:hypothetical protein
MPLAAAMLIPGLNSRAAMLFQSDHSSHEPGHPLPPPSKALKPRKPLPAPLPPKNELPEILRDWGDLQARRGATASHRV